jgi:GDP-4-dehydro-6-deoxy-D-mannose reductase
MKSILVTGASGFIGSALVNRLQFMGYKVTQFSSIDGDISDVNFTKEYKNSNFFHVFHLASKTFVPDSWENPYDFYKTAILGTVNILQLCRVKNIPLTYVSAYLYGIPEDLPINEGHRVKPNNPYAHSKFLAEDLCKFYSEFHDVKVSIARPFNVYGVGQKKTFLIPFIIKQVLYEDNITVKDLNPKRDYIYLDDLISGLISTISCKEKFSIFNFGSGKGLSVSEIIKTIQKIAGTNKEIISEKKERIHEIMNVIADVKKSREYLNWTPSYSFEDGVREILKQELKLHG